MGQFEQAVALIGVDRPLYEPNGQSVTALDTVRPRNEDNWYIQLVHDSCRPTMSVHAHPDFTLRYTARLYPTDSHENQLE